MYNSHYLSSPANFLPLALCDLTNPPVLSTTEAPLGFNSTCLCTPEDFRESAPACIDCLFRTDIEEEFRDTLLKGMDGCTKNLNLPTCPRKCNGIEQMMTECAEEDAARSAAAAVPTPEVTGSDLKGNGDGSPAGSESSEAPTSTTSDTATYV